MDISMETDPSSVEKQEVVNTFSVLSENESIRYIETLKREKEIWKALYKEKHLLWRNQKENTSEDSDDSQFEDVTLLEEDLKFFAGAPNYSEISKLFSEIHEELVTVMAKHYKTMKSFNYALQRMHTK